MKIKKQKIQAPGLTPHQAPDRWTHYIRGKGKGKGGERGKGKGKGKGTGGKGGGGKAVGKGVWVERRACHDCNEVGHIARDCQKPRKARTFSLAEEAANLNMRALLCLQSLPGPLRVGSHLAGSSRNADVEATRTGA